MNQYRCDNGCKHNDNHYCELLKCRISFSEISVFEQFGCASHSDFQSGWDTVLDEVLQLPQRREQPNGSMYIYVNDVKALRQAGEP